jgi:hypothetical protein
MLASGLLANSAVRCERLHGIPQLDVRNTLGALSPALMRQIDVCLRPRWRSSSSPHGEAVASHSPAVAPRTLGPQPRPRAPTPNGVASMPCHAVRIRSNPRGVRAGSPRRYPACAARRPAFLSEAVGVRRQLMTGWRVSHDDVQTDRMWFCRRGPIECGWSGLGRDRPAEPTEGRGGSTASC